MIRRVLTVVAALACVLPRTVQGWGPEGHHIVARIGLERLAPETRQAVEQLLAPEDFVAVSTWADDIRKDRPETYNWHFVDIPYSEFHYDAARDCKPTPQGDCVVAELVRARHDLTDTSLSKEQRREALKWVIHLMGDLHQPLHAIDNHDRGGNDVMVTLVGQPPPPPGVNVNLHSVWDTRVIANRDPDETSYLGALTTEFKGNQPASGTIDFIAWAESSHQIAVEYVYTYPGFSPGSPPGHPVELSQSYQNDARLAVDHQLELAGVRLAAVLNSAFRRTGIGH
jgi:hypothetical protein